MTNALTRRTGRPWWMTPFGREPLGDYSLTGFGRNIYGMREKK